MPCSLDTLARSVSSLVPDFVTVGGKMDDITVIVAQVKTVVVPEDEVDLQNHSILIQKQRRLIFFYLFGDVDMCYFRVATQKNKRVTSKALLLWLHLLNKMNDQEQA
jgi:hypothetical protein